MRPFGRILLVSSGEGEDHADDDQDRNHNPDPLHDRLSTFME